MARRLSATHSGVSNAVVAVLIASVLFGTTGTALDLGPDDATALGAGTFRIVVGAAALWVFARRRLDLGLLRRHRWLFVAGGATVALYQPAFFVGTQRSGVALGTVVALGSGPVFAGMVEWVWTRRRPRRVWAVATAVSLAGGVLLVFAGDVGADGDGGGASIDLVGLAGSLTAGFAYAVYATTAKALIGRGVPSTVSLAWPFTIGAVILLPFGLAEPLGWIGTAGGALMLAHLGVLTVGLAYALYGAGLRMLDTSTAVTLTLAEPLTASILGVAVLDERLRWFGWVGAVLVLVGLLLAGGFPWRHRRALRAG